MHVSCIIRYQEVYYYINSHQLSSVDNFLFFPMQLSFNSIHHHAAAVNDPYRQFVMFQLRKFSFISTNLPYSIQYKYINHFTSVIPVSINKASCLRSDFITLCTFTICNQQSSFQMFHQMSHFNIV